MLHHKQQHMSMFMAGTSHELAILAYFRRGGLEKQQGGPPRSSCDTEILQNLTE